MNNLINFDSFPVDDNLALKRKYYSSVHTCKSNATKLQQSIALKQQLLEDAEGLRNEHRLDSQKRKVEVEKLRSRVRTTRRNGELQEKQLRNALEACRSRQAAVHQVMTAMEAKTREFSIIKSWN